MKHLTLSLGAFLALSGQLSAETHDNVMPYLDGTYPEIPVSVQALVSALEDGDHLGWVEYADLDADGKAEAVIGLNNAISAEEPDFLEWRVYADQDGMGVQVGSWYGWDVSVERADPHYKDLDPLPVVVSDGSFWTLNLGKMKPFGGLEVARPGFTTRGRVSEKDVFSDIGITNVDQQWMARVEIDASKEHPGSEILISLVGEGYWDDADGSTPYVLLASDGTRIHSGRSFTHPSIYKLPDGGFQIIENINFGYRAIMFEEDQE